MAIRKQLPAQSKWQERTYRIIFEADTRAGKAFDVALLIAIVLSVVAVMLDSVDGVRASFGGWLRVLEWFFTVAFTIEYILRLACVRSKTNYARSFFGIVDLLSILPTYISVFFPGSHSLLVIRALRLLRIFRVFKLAHFLGEANLLLTALRASRPKVIVFIGTVLVLDLILGSTMYLIEGAASGFTSIPRSVYWAIVTMTTVGYGDIAPQTVLGQAIAAAAMILGYSILAVPTGIVTSELFEAARHSKPTTRVCASCLSEGHTADARYCKDCGMQMTPPE